METAQGQERALLRGGPFDGDEVPVSGLWFELPKAPDSVVQYSWQLNDEGVIFGQYEKTSRMVDGGWEQIDP